jgi:hypothetical protein
MKKNILAVISILVGVMFCSSCKKDWLDKKSDISLVVPSSLSDFQALLDNTISASLAFTIHNCILGESGSDNYYLTSTAYATLPPNDQNAYTWNLNVYQTGTAPDWSGPYGQVYAANVVLDGLNKLNANPSNQEEYNNIKGSALFYRGFAYYDMSQIFAKPYDNATSKTDLGLPLRTIPNIVSVQARASVEDTYAFFINDLKTAIPLLPILPKYKTRPSKPAAYGMLARAYLAMSDYSNAYLYADSCLQLYSTLIPYSTFNLAAANPIPNYNNEIIYLNSGATSVFRTTTLNVDSNLYASFASNDLRKTIFFKKDGSGNVKLFGRYSASTSQLFDGLAVDEMYMIRAEAGVRTGKLTNAMTDLNTLLVTRWKPGTYNVLTASNTDDALNLILQERRKELCFRGLRWSDLRRLNKDPRYAITLTRMLNGKTYTLKLNDSKYVYQIPAMETNFNTAIVQNPQ